METKSKADIDLFQEGSEHRNKFKEIPRALHTGLTPRSARRHTLGTPRR